MKAISLDASLRAMGAKAEAFGRWAAGRRYWTFFLLMCVVVVLKTGFKWAGVTGNGWYVEYKDVIDAWPLKENLADPSRAHWQEFYSGVLSFRAFTAVGFPESQATWLLVHALASAGAILLIGLWAKRTYGPLTSRGVAALVLFGAAPMILLQEIGRYDSFFFLGAVLLVTARRWPAVVIGALVMGTSTWVMSGVTSISLVLVGAALASRSLMWRGAAGVGGTLAGALGLMGLRFLSGGDVMLKKGMIGDQGQSDQSFADVVARTWWNVVQPFPNWIYAALGLTWILFALVIFQQTRRKWALAAAMLVLPVIAFAANTSDGTRDLALPITPLVLAAAGVLAARAGQGRGDEDTGGFSPRFLGVILVLCLIAPVIDVNPHTPLNPYQWLGLRGLSVVWHALGQ